MLIRNPALLRALFRASGRLRSKSAPARATNGPVKVTRYLNDAPGAASISADFELAWAWREWGTARAEEVGLRERANVPVILELLDRLDIPITWATVGHLFLESCGEKKNGLHHSNMPRPLYNGRWRGDWYQHDPATNLATHAAWYAPDLIRSIQVAKIPHEIGSHSFSHIEFSPECSTEDLVTAEILECQRSMGRFGIQPRTLVYPFNIMGHQHLPLLARLGLAAVRHRDARFALACPERDSSGVYKIYETMALRESRWYHQPTKAAILLDEAIRKGLCFHFWFHPSAVTVQGRATMHEIFQHIARLRGQGQIWVATMKDLAAYSEARERMSIQVTGSGQKATLRMECPIDRERFGDPEVTLCVLSSHTPLSITATASNRPDQPATLSFRFDAGSGLTTFNVRSSTSDVEITWPDGHATGTRRGRERL
ncbi:MAG: hypothetical protein DME87_07855 [Verrucomicrobia bacterium]|nr:MAG: hypothetical protein DME87_07855 [Verrucomicrobiota bacterium]